MIYLKQENKLIKVGDDLMNYKFVTTTPPPPFYVQCSV